VSFRCTVEYVRRVSERGAVQIEPCRPVRRPPRLVVQGCELAGAKQQVVEPVP